ncbi:HNH endonuclease signature motif containing protein [Mesorhizobium sp.]|uniref:HNH endonuclease signature motif containing protein n=1 Tax=Mesorhizobium sp. TaxID=1871066 RepID=UPI000FE35CCC|nr:HNH endonuclease signature motif containing protein [Mesorhizobium sp.]RWK39229.1 MAG: HNH endonuclease [Mesorhizobium sp.]
MDLSQVLVRQFLDYDPETGALTWRARDEKWFNSARAHRIWNTKNAGRPAGTLNQGYVQIAIFRRTHHAHRMIWLWMTGETPEQIDHQNHNRADNRWENLRATTAAGNRKNQSRSRANTSGVTGVYWYKRDSKWQARIKADGVDLHLGYFADKTDAIAARKRAEAKFGFHENHGSAQ